MGQTIAVALSGGIDSLVAAALLKDQGHALIGLHFLNGYETGAAPARQDGHDPHFTAIEAHARRTMAPLAEQLGIPLYIIDLRQEFQSQVVDYFINAYSAGFTPNPCLVCNPIIKFDILLERARTLGATQMATGHYARITTTPDGQRLRLMQGVDTHKDQSYFLARLSQAQLATAVLPLGNLRKEQTRRIAHRKGLIPPTARESQDVCFIRDGHYADFLTRNAGDVPQPGPIEDMRGRVVGRHNGLHRFTIGQRRGINCPAAEPYYVVRLDRERNCLVVGSKQALLRRRCIVSRINWIAPVPQRPTKVGVRIRYRHQAVPATLSPIDAQQAEIAFDMPESAVTPGQGAVFYKADEVLGGGWIE